MFKRKLVNILSVGSLLAICTACNNGSGTSGGSASETAPFTVNSVGLVNHPTSATPGMDVYLHFTADESATNWKMGFYMPFTFKKVTWWNPNLTLQICEEPTTGNYTNCGELQYDENKGNGVPAAYDTSAGWTTVFSVAESSSFQTLNRGTNYAIIAMNNSLGVARNYASYPQNFFAIINNHVINLKSTTPDMYTVSDYNQSTIDAENNQHISDNWSNSLPESNTSVGIVPSPVNYVAGTAGNYAFANGVAIHNQLSISNTVANLFQSELISDIKVSSTVDNNLSATTGVIIRPISDPSLINNNPEGYQLSVSANSVIINAVSDAGAFYALQTLRQLWVQSPTIKGMTVTDYPRFKYRGLGVDSARHFVPADQIKTILDLMAIQKLNVLHLRIGDDEGWRLSLPDYPTLTSIGAKRGYGNTLGDNLIGAQLTKQANLDLISGITNPELYATPTDYYTGTYSKSDIASLISYANARQITIIPEIDIPGHARAMVKALPDAFFDVNDQSAFASVQGFSDDVIPVCTYNSSISVGSKFTVTINDIVRQIASTFNNQNTLYAVANEVSVGADEVSGAAWSNDSSCQGSWASMTALAKGQYFFELFSQDNADLKLSGWQQLVQNDDVTIGDNVVPPGNVGHIWVWNSAAPGTPQASSLADHNYPTVLAFSDQLYFDLTYNKDKTELGQYWATSYADTQAALSSAMSASASMSGTTNPANIEGLEGELWGENMVTFGDVIYMAAPKMAGLSEAGWAPENITTNGTQVNWQSLANRLGCGQTGLLATLNKLYGVQYRGYPNGISKEAPTVCGN